MVHAEHLFPAGALLDDHNPTNYYKGSFKDVGCQIADSCLACPLPTCKYDNPRQLGARVARVQITECKRGHPYNGVRPCRACALAYNQARRERTKAANA